MVGRRLIAAVVAGLIAAPSAASAAPDWWLIAAGPDGAMRYFCGDACRQTQLICLKDVRPAAEASRVEQLADVAYTPWGQIDYSVMAQISADRAGLDDLREIDGGKRESGPELTSFGGADWVAGHYGLQTKGDGRLSATLLLWPQDDSVAMWRCSYKADVDDGRDIEASIRQLAESLRLTP